MKPVFYIDDLREGEELLVRCCLTRTNDLARAKVMVAEQFNENPGHLVAFFICRRQAILVTRT